MNMIWISLIAEWS